MSDFILALPVLIFALVAHEYAHARAALSQGDNTAYMLGRVTLNPIPHIDPWMTLLFPAILWFGSGGAFAFGGAKPVPVETRKFRNFVRGDIIVSSAGVITNLALAFGCAAVFIGLSGVARVLPAVGDGVGILQRMMSWGIYLNLVLCFFNIIPIPPLDGSRVFYHFLPPELGLKYRRVEQLGFIPLMVVLIFLPGVTNFFLAPARWGFGMMYQVLAPFGIGRIWDLTVR
ncbi:MAG: site-2 protease family protein [Gemmatimonadota bacterium]|nr:site-2 protease family protein [Gemmatimonadota bacterium]MDH5283186.1 site-2 protease family protein [Gemmatimonadota bacterium]